MPKRKVGHPVTVRFSPRSMIALEHYAADHDIDTIESAILTIIRDELLAQGLIVPKPGNPFWEPVKEVLDEEVNLIQNRGRAQD